MLLLITGSNDGTSDRLCIELAPSVFRLNYDIWQSYFIDYNPDFWVIRNPSGLEISSETVSGVLFWKAFSYDLPYDNLIINEVKYIFKDLYGWCIYRGLLVGTPYDFHSRIGKINTLSLAKKYFCIPKTRVSINNTRLSSIFESNVAVKSLSSALSDDKKPMMTTEVEPSDLDFSYPWYLQDIVKSDWDITVFQCGNDLFSFRRDRKGLKGIDWRVEQNFDFKNQEWFIFELDDKDKDKLIKLSADLNIDFGRYDFMLDKLTEKLVFLEFNANGQWVFLDVHNKFGLLKSVIKYIKKSCNSKFKDISNV